MDTWNAIQKVVENAHYSTGGTAVEYIRRILNGENPEVVLEEQKQYENEVDRVYEEECLKPELTKLLETYGQLDHLEEQVEAALTKLKVGDMKEAVAVLKLISEYHNDCAASSQEDDAEFDYHNQICLEIDRAVEKAGTPV